ncbi:hypothetical protein M9458_050824, partial [Cirrhinus mrigala]
PRGLMDGGIESQAAEACWAHNSEIDGSKPSSAKAFELAYVTEPQEKGKRSEPVCENLRTISLLIAVIHPKES